MAEDLAIDVGIQKDSEEYDMFIKCIENILEYGCRYNQKTTDNIIDKCKQSNLEIASKVLQELESPAKTYRKNRLKWWQTWRSSKEPEDKKRPAPPHTRTKRRQDRRPPRPRRPMSPMFEQQQDRRPPRRKQNEAQLNAPGRPMSPMFEQRQGNRRRPMSPMFEQRQGNRRRPISPMFEQRQDNRRRKRSVVEREQASDEIDYHRKQSSVPEWSTKKRRRY